MVPGLSVFEAPARRTLAAAFADDVRRGLSDAPKTLSSSGFYDDRGSQLFQQITELPEYYLTRCEGEILSQHALDIAGPLEDERFRLIEVGAGDGRKTATLLEQFKAAGLSLEYVPVDICSESVVGVTNRFRRRFGENGLRVRGIVADYFDAFPLIRRQTDLRKLILFLGSSIGNFGHRQARGFLQALRQSLVPGDLALIGFDLKKDPSILQQAYDDAAGVTREFNLNLLDRINRELGGDFRRSRFQHHASYNFRLGCMESHLVSTERQQVPLRSLKMTASFEAWEPVRVERSYKYDLHQIETFAASAGFRILEHYFDEQEYFVDSLWEAVL